MKNGVYVVTISGDHLGSLGESALLARSPRTADAIAEDHTECMRLDRSTFYHISGFVSAAPGPTRTLNTLKAIGFMKPTPVNKGLKSANRLKEKNPMANFIAMQKEMKGVKNKSETKKAVKGRRGSTRQRRGSITFQDEDGGVMDEALQIQIRATRDKVRREWTMLRNVMEFETVKSASVAQHVVKFALKFLSLLNKSKKNAVAKADRCLEMEFFERVHNEPNLIADFPNLASKIDFMDLDLAVQSIGKILKTALRKGGDNYCLIERDSEELHFLSAFTSRLDFFTHFSVTKNHRKTLAAGRCANMLEKKNKRRGKLLRNLKTPKEVSEFQFNCAKTMQLLQVPAGECLFQEGDDVFAAYIVLSGRMVITSTDSRGFSERTDRNGKVPLNPKKNPETHFNKSVMLRAGDSIGEHSLTLKYGISQTSCVKVGGTIQCCDRYDKISRAGVLTPPPRSPMCVPFQAVTRTTLIVINRDAFKSIVLQEGVADVANVAHEKAQILASVSVFSDVHFDILCILSRSVQIKTVPSPYF